MKVTVHMKTPDAVHYAVCDTFEDHDLRAEAEEKLERWIEYGECVSIEFDLEKMTATVLRA